MPTLDERQDEPDATDYRVVLTDTRDVDGVTYQRMLVQTPWLTEADDLPTVLASALKEHLQPGDTAFVAEKITIVTTGRTVDVSTVKVGWLARRMAPFGRPIGVDMGMAMPERLQYVIDRVGVPRILLAGAAAVLTRPFKVRGAFYVVAGTIARDLDGLHDPYWNTLLPPLLPKEARALATSTAAALGSPLAIVDINDRGGHIKGVSPGSLPARTILAALKDNPMGHCSQSTGVGILRRV